MQVDKFIEEKPSLSRIRDVIQKVLNALNLGIEFGSPAGTKPPGTTINIKGSWAQGATPGVADAEFAVTHNLGYIPAGFITWKLDKAAILYQGVTVWNTKQIFLKCNVATVNYTIFVQ